MYANKNNKDSKYFFSRTDDFPPPMDLRTYELLNLWTTDPRSMMEVMVPPMFSTSCGISYAYVYQDYIVVCHPVVIIVL